MKKILFLLLALITCLVTVNAQEYYAAGSDAFPIDTLTNSDTLTFTFPAGAASQAKKDWITWEIAITNLADTASVTIINEQSLGGTVWTPKDTIVSGVNSIGGNVLGYLKTIWQQGRNSRLKIYSAGTSSSAQVKVWAEKIYLPFQISDIALP